MDVLAFAREWEDGWNSHDLDRIMGHYREDIIFRSCKALPIVGSGEIVSKQNLRSYWAVALEQQPDLHFRVDDVFDGYEMVVIAYRNHRNALATETLYFDVNGEVFQAAACHLRKSS